MTTQKAFYKFSTSFTQAMQFCRETILITSADKLKTKIFTYMTTNLNQTTAETVVSNILHMLTMQETIMKARKKGIQ
ncbi:CLUMA_CG007697, isoform A [Clunio marinus]|uniref:CLUMA_CG007697, isoform A n=1 Tax=Clunio marinus TaxID=568069 RepID=A0A1J1I1L9_9DIPT|nr:CLUMA_CG007697, isoform A [Clunio marinus]